MTKPPFTNDLSLIISHLNRNVKNAQTVSGKDKAAQDENAGNGIP